ncbi:MAG: gliding motility lipoprotein GldH [Flavobacteriales bacterium]
MMRVRFFVTFLFVLVLVSCGDKPFFQQNTAIEDQSWNWNEPVSYEVQVDDTVSSYNFYLDLRVTKSYEYSNIYVFFTTMFPDGKTARDTIQANLQDEFGIWYGKPTGSLVDNRILFGPKRVFPVAGKYGFTIEQAMREKDLTEVADVGLRIERSKK